MIDMEPKQEPKDKSCAYCGEECISPEEYIDSDTCEMCRLDPLVIHGDAVPRYREGYGE